MKVGRMNGARRVDEDIPNEHGFSAIEILGVLAVLAVLAALVTPMAINRIDLKYFESEEENLQKMATGLREYVKTYREIPGSGGWASAIASELELSLNEIQSNTRGNARRFLIDPNFWDTGDASLPYDQTWEGRSTPPKSPRLIIISSIHDPLPSGTLDFGALWDVADGELPETDPAWTSWSGEAGDVAIQRIHLGDLFHRVLLHNVDASPDAKFEVDNGNLQLASSTPWRRHFLHGTALGLYDLAASPQEVTRLIVKDDLAYYYAQELWRKRFTFGGRNDWLDDLAAQLRAWIEDNGFELNDLNVDMKVQQFQIMGPGANPGSK